MSVRRALAPLALVTLTACVPLRIAQEDPAFTAVIHHHIAAGVTEVGPELAAVMEARLAELEAMPRWNLARESTWDAIAECESGGNWAANTGNGYSGGLQFDVSSWRGAGGSGYAWQASRAEQIHRANIWLDLTSWDSWPTCARRLGLR